MAYGTDVSFRKYSVHEKVFCSSLTPQDHVFTNCLQGKIKQKGRRFDECKVCLGVQGQLMRKKGQDSDGDYKDDYSPVPVASSFHAIISLATYVSSNTHTTQYLHRLISHKESFKKNYYLQMTTMASCKFLHLQDATIFFFVYWLLERQDTRRGGLG